LWYFCWISLSSAPPNNFGVPYANALILNPNTSLQLLNYPNSVVGNIGMDYPPSGLIAQIIATNNENRTGYCCFYPEPNFCGEPLCITDDEEKSGMCRSGWR